MKSKKNERDSVEALSKALSEYHSSKLPRKLKEVLLEQSFSMRYGFDFSYTLLNFFLEKYDTSELLRLYSKSTKYIEFDPNLNEVKIKKEYDKHSFLFRKLSKLTVKKYWYFCIYFITAFLATMILAFIPALAKALASFEDLYVLAFLCVTFYLIAWSALDEHDQLSSAEFLLKKLDIKHDSLNPSS
ncbi:hypothetical protein [Hydrogenovibrio marinus]|nr:hypothetical protein [Hydrogenovibrio marinus]